MLAVAAIVLLLAGAWLWLSRKEAELSPKAPTAHRPSRIAGSTPAPAQKLVEEPLQKESRIFVTNAEGIPIGKNGKPLWLYPPPPIDRLCVTTGTHSVQSIQEKVFVHPSDQTVASLLMMQPGDVLVGESDDMFNGFTEQFLKSLETPIVIEEDDADFVKELKAGVRETRKELKARLDAGEDIEKTLVETRKELRSLGLYREELEEHLREFSADKAMTEQDLRDFVEAANIMLKERGAREIEMPEMIIRRLRLRDARRKSAGNR